MGQAWANPWATKTLVYILLIIIWPKINSSGPTLELGKRVLHTTWTFYKKFPRDPCFDGPALKSHIAQLVACNIENDSKVCYQSACLEQLSDCRDPKLRNFVRECARGCFAPVTCGGRG